MTREELKELVESLEDQARDKDLLSGGDPESIFARDSAALLEAARLLRSLPPSGTMTPEQLRELDGDPV